MIIDEHTVIPFAPDWSFAIKHSRRQRTGLAEGLTGMEERAAYFSKPKQRIQYTITTDGGASAFAVETTLKQALESAKAAVPLWGRQQVIDTAVNNQITLETPSTLFQAGDWIGMARPLGDIASTVRIQSVSEQTINLENSAPANSGDLIIPIVLGRIDSVPGELIGGGGRAFEIRFNSSPPLEAINAQFVFTEVDSESNWLSFLTNLYFLFYVDGSGSMDDDRSNVIGAANQLKVMLRDMIYGGDEVQASHFVRVSTSSQERWLEWLSRDVSGEVAARYVSLAFINEADPRYHDTPRSDGVEPTAIFMDDYNTFQTEFARREYSRSKIYSINPTSQGWSDENQSFNAHLAEAVSGQGNYANLGPPLSDSYVFNETGIAAGTPAEEYVADIFELLGVR